MHTFLTHNKEKDILVISNTIIVISFFAEEDKTVVRRQVSQSQLNKLALICF